MRKKHVILAVVALLAGFNAWSSGSQVEINHLLDFVKSTDCRYERNGDMHTGPEAVKHIQKKYDYYEDDILSAEDFIKYAATKSTMSGDYYLVHCAASAPIKSESWLLTELNHFRASKEITH